MLRPLPPLSVLHAGFASKGAAEAAVARLKKAVGKGTLTKAVGAAGAGRPAAKLSIKGISYSHVDWS